MADFRFFQVDAFSDRPFGGNPAAVVLLEQWLDDGTLQAIAEENNLSETAFLVPDAVDDGAFELRWFTPTVEVDLCGHATLASGHVVLSERSTRDAVRFVTRRSGTLSVTPSPGGLLALDLPALEPVTADAADAAGAPGPDRAGLEEALRAPVEQLLVHGSGYLLCVLDSEARVRSLAPDFHQLARVGRGLVIVTAPGADRYDVVSRAFAPAFGIDEDPVTGAAHAVLTPYWARRLGRDRFSAYQASRRGGAVECRIQGNRVELAGRCRTVIRGTLSL